MRAHTCRHSSHSAFNLDQTSRSSQPRLHISRPVPPGKCCDAICNHRKWWPLCGGGGSAWSLFILARVIIFRSRSWGSGHRPSFVGWQTFSFVERNLIYLQIQEQRQIKIKTLTIPKVLNTFLWIFNQKNTQKKRKDCGISLFYLS